MELPARWVLSHVAQELIDVERDALDFVMDGDAELREVEAAIREAEAAHDEGERAAMLRKPPHILVTTPESLYLLLTAERAREMLKTARAVTAAY